MFTSVIRNIFPRLGAGHQALSREYAFGHETWICPEATKSVVHHLGYSIMLFHPAGLRFPEELLLPSLKNRRNVFSTQRVHQEENSESYFWNASYTGDVEKALLHDDETLRATITKPLSNYYVACCTGSVSAEDASLWSSLY